MNTTFLPHTTPTLGIMVTPEVKFTGDGISDGYSPETAPDFSPPSNNKDTIDLQNLKNSNQALLASAKAEAQAHQLAAKQRIDQNLKNYLVNDFLGKDFGNGVTGYTVLATLVALEEQAESGMGKVKKYGRLLRLTRPSFTPIRKIVKTTFTKKQYKNVDKALVKLQDNGYLKWYMDPTIWNVTVKTKVDRTLLLEALQEFKALQAEK